MILLDGRSLTCESLHAIGSGESVSLDPDALGRMAANAARIPPGPSVLERKRLWLVGEHSRDLPAADLARAFITGHCAGVGELLPKDHIRAAIAVRINVLLRAHSACRPVAVQVLAQMLERDVIPDVPSQGSAGVGGDPALAHIAAVACGYTGDMQGIEPLDPTPKEALALINGPSFWAAQAAIAVARSHRVFDAAVTACAMSMEAVRTDTGAIDARPYELRGHPGAVTVAARLRDLLAGSHAVTPGRTPDAFSVRCAPTILGAALDALAQVRDVVVREINGTVDNPLLIDGDWVETGNFHGAPLALALDHLKLAVTQVATQSERRTYRLTYGQLTDGLPSFLVAGTGLNSGFMLAQYTAASLTSECKGFAHPASVDTIPTIQHHEDHTSMAPVAARTALRAIECVADIVAIEALVAAQALDLRERGLAFDEEDRPIPAERAVLAPAIASARDRVREVVAFWEDDEVMHPALANAGMLVRRGGLSGADLPW